MLHQLKPDRLQLSLCHHRQLLNHTFAALGSQIQAKGQFIPFQVVRRAVRINQFEQPRGRLDHSVPVASGQAVEIRQGLYSQRMQTTN